jgi:hypothetical protein
MLSWRILQGEPISRTLSRRTRRLFLSPAVQAGHGAGLRIVGTTGNGGTHALAVPHLVRDQWAAVNNGLPLASLIWAAHTFWIAVTTLSGIGT